MKNLAFTPAKLWSVIDRIVVEKKLGSASRLAIMAGLDATALNKSKRFKGRKNRQDWHWLSMQSISKILAAANVSLEEFARMVDE